MTENKNTQTTVQLDSYVKTLKICSAIWFLFIPMIVAFVIGIILTIKTVTELTSKHKNYSYYLVQGILGIVTCGVWWIILIVANVMPKESAILTSTIVDSEVKESKEGDK